MIRHSTGNTSPGPGSSGDGDRSPTITGQGTLPGGSYGTISVAGMVRITGDVEARAISTQGSVTVDGATAAAELVLSGEAVLAGPVEAERAELDGSSRITGDLAAGVVKLSGSHTVGGGVTSQRFEARGVFDIAGRLFANQIAIELHGEARAETIKGTDVSVRCAEPQGQTRISLRRGRVTAVARTTGAVTAERRHLTAGTIEGDDVKIEATTAKRVSGARVTVGPGCDIGRVEYSQWLQASPEATIGSSVRVES